MKLHFLVDGKLVGRVKYVEVVGITQWLELPKSIPYIWDRENVLTARSKMSNYLSKWHEISPVSSYPLSLRAIATGLTFHLTFDLLTSFDLPGSKLIMSGFFTTPSIDIYF